MPPDQPPERLSGSGRVGGFVAASAQGKHQAQYDNDGKGAAEQHRPRPVGQELGAKHREDEEEQGEEHGRIPGEVAKRTVNRRRPESPARQIHMHYTLGGVCLAPPRSHVAMNAELSPRAERLLLLTLAGIQFAHILDFMIMMPLGPILMRAFQINAGEFGFLVASYSFSAAAAGLFGAVFVDRFERKRLLLVIVGLFALATLACALAPGYATLLVARGLAGIFGGILGAQVQTLIGDTIPFARRAHATGFVASAFSLSTIAGVPLSLWLANLLGWHAPFVLVAALALLCLAVGARCLPELRSHLGSPAHPFAAAADVLRDGNHLRALLFSALVIFSGFTVIPYITIQAVGNVGIAQSEIPLVYFIGGAATFFTARAIGRWADRRGKALAYRWLALAALLPLLLVTHVGHLPLWGWLICSTSFFVLVSGRMIPAMAIVTSAAQARVRGTFMSLNGTVQATAMGLATTLGGMLVTVDPGGALHGYELVGYIAMAANLLAVLWVGRVVMHTQR